MATLLSICQAAADEIGLQHPSLIVGSNNAEARRLLRLATKEGRELARRGDWEILTSEQTFTSVATETQTAMIPTDWGRFINETFWNRTRKLPFYGPVTAQEWQQIKSWSSSPVTHTFRTRGGDILISPVPTAGDTYAFEYVSKYWCEDTSGDGRTAWAADTDVPRLDDELLTLGLVWRFKKSAELPWEADYAVYDAAVRQALTMQKPRKTLQMGGYGESGAPRRVIVPDGSWNL